MAQVLRTSRAENDLLEILEYIGRDNLRAAARFAAVLEEKCQMLAQFPATGSLCENLGAGVRCFTVGKYVIFYRPLNDGMEVLRVLHGARHFP